jgi:hypothetical protein
VEMGRGEVKWRGISGGGEAKGKGRGERVQRKRVKALNKWCYQFAAPINNIVKREIYFWFS